MIFLKKKYFLYICTQKVSEEYGKNNSLQYTSRGLYIQT